MGGSKNKKIKKIKQILTIPFMLLIGFGGGIIIGSFMEEKIFSDRSLGEIIVSAALLLLGMYAAVFLQIVIHEAGHLIFGLMSGYHFSSFRVGSFMLLKEGGKFKFRKISISGTGGQCLLIPPGMKDGKYPYILYNLGGSIINLVSAALFAGAAYLGREIAILTLFLMIFAVIGIVFALINGIPMRFNNVDNDGYNALSISRNSEGLRAFWIQLKVNELVASGVRPKDMPDEWFELPSGEAMKNSIAAVINVLASSRLMDQKRFEDAKQLMDKLLQMDTGIVGLHRSLLIVDRIYCELIGENRQQVLNNMLDKKQKRLMKAMKSFPTVLRTEYTYALIAEKDEAKAAVIKNKFEKMAEKYPYPSDIAAERELFTYAEGLANLQGK